MQTYPGENGGKNLVLSGGLFVKFKVAMFCQTIGSFYTKAWCGAQSVT